jgi:8-oxo-dGTP diphosphatase
MHQWAILYTGASGKKKHANAVLLRQLRANLQFIPGGLSLGLETMPRSREYPELPMIGIGGVVIRDGRALLIRRGSEPLKGEWSIPGGMLEVGETLIEGVARELLEETGLNVKVVELIEVFERIFPADELRADTKAALLSSLGRPLYHFVIIDYLCESTVGVPHAGGDVTDVAFAAEEELARFGLTPTATRVMKKAFAMARARHTQAKD